MIDFSSEIYYKTARSGGKGGQNVNKVETMVEAYWQVAFSVFFSEEQKNLITQKLQHRINKEGLLMVKSQEARTQLANKKLATHKLLALVNNSIIQPKSRKKPTPSKAMIEKRLQAKKHLSEKKAMRSKHWE